jgi:hypothetical protein
MTAASVDELLFSEEGVRAVVNHETKIIEFHAHDTVNISALAPRISFKGQSLEPPSGTVVDFTGSPSYTVTAGTGKTITYPVTVTVSDEIPVYDLADLEKIGDSLHPFYGLDKKYILLNNISADTWKPIGNLVADMDSYPASVSMRIDSTPFTGIFRGNNKTITIRGFDSGVYLERGTGIFACTDGARVENLRVFYNYTGTLELSDDSGRFMGGITGYARKSELVNLRVSGTLNMKQIGFFGGIAGYTGNDHTGSGTALIENSFCDANIRLENSKPSAVLYGGCIAGMNDSGIGTSTIRNCHSTGTIEASGISTTYLGGIAADNGRADAANSGTRSIINCSSSGAVRLNISSGEAIAGGITGNSRAMTADSSNILNCYASGAVSALSGGDNNVFAGGITGYSQRTVFTDCYSTGNVSASGNGNVFSGGLVGGLYTGNLTVRNCYAAGRVNAVSGSYTHGVFAGGITGRINEGTGTIVTANGAANPSVSASGVLPAAHRIVGANNGGTASGNIAYSAMSVTGGTIIEGSALDGESKTTAELLTHGTWETLFGAGFAANWKWLSGYPYPVLQWQNSAPAWTALP